MIGYLRGTILSKKPYEILLDVNGVGYELRVPYSTSQLPASGKELSLVVHTHVREDALTLYGFKTAAEREMFHQLLTVKNVGPKIALMVLAAVTPADIANAIRRNNPLAMVVPGIGPKTAERIVQELRSSFVGRSGAHAHPRPAAQRSRRRSCLGARKHGLRLQARPEGCARGVTIVEERGWI
jgi:Holliday junction DNA helicase RuvA